MFLGRILKKLSLIAVACILLHLRAVEMRLRGRQHLKRNNRTDYKQISEMMAGRSKRTTGTTTTSAIIRATKTEEMLRYLQTPGEHQLAQQQAAEGTDRNSYNEIDLHLACNDFYEFACSNWLPYQQQQDQYWSTHASSLSLPFISVNKHLTTEREMQLKVRRQLQVIFEESTPTIVYSNQPAQHLSRQDTASTLSLPIRQDERNLKNFYRACKLIENNSLLQRKYVHDFVIRNGGLPYLSGTRSWQEENYRWLQIIGRLRHYYGLNILLDFQIVKNPINMRTNIIIDEPKKLLLPEELCFQRHSKKGSENSKMNYAPEYDMDFNLIQDHIKDNLRYWFELKEMEAQRLAGDILRFEFEICQHLKSIKSTNNGNKEEDSIMDDDEQVPTSARWSSMASGLHGSLQSPNHHPKNLLVLNKIYDINLKEYVDICLDSSIHTQVYIESEAYLGHLAHLAKTWPMQTFANYIIYKALDEINVPVKRQSAASSSVDQRAMYCVSKVMELFPELSGELYQRRYLRNDIKQEAEVIFQSIKYAFQRAIEVDWISQNTRRIMKQKLSQVHLSFPEYHRSYSSNMMMINIESLDYWHKLEYLMYYRSNRSLYQSQYSSISNNNHQSNANNQNVNILEATSVQLELNSPINNQLQIGWALLQPPFYSIYYPMSLKFSTLGFRLARKLFKIFDIEGWNSNPTIRWDEFTASNFLNRTKCLHKQLRNYLNKDSFNYYWHYLRYSSNGNRNQFRELLADNVGVKVAFDAYLNWLESIDYNSQNILIQETLINLNFTNTQLFFLHYAQTNCAVIRKGKDGPASKSEQSVQRTSNKLHFPQDFHTWERFRLNAPLWNNEEFGRDFNCRIGSDMNLHDKCTIY